MRRYPGIRSDSAPYTFGYRFKPWTGAPIATAAEIRKYTPDTSCAACTCCRSESTSPRWQHTQDYWTERDVLPAADLDDGCLV